MSSASSASFAPARDVGGQSDAAYVRELRTRLGLSQGQLAARLDVSNVTVSRWENGHSGISAAGRRRLGQLELAGAAVDPAGGPLAGALPVPLSSFIGRDREIASVTALLARGRLVCLAGPGGAGKTRLALEVLRRRPAGADRAVFAAMDQLSDPALVGTRVATALGIRERPGRLGGDMVGGNIGETARTLGWDAEWTRAGVRGSTRDKALAKAVEEMKPYFHQCGRCGQWACGQICWNTERGMCVTCAPKLDQEIAGMQAAAQVQQLNTKIKQQDWTGDINYRDTATAMCPSCHGESGSGKFCQHCGATLAAAGADRHCGTCGTALGPARFCGECGTPANT